MKDDFGKFFTILSTDPKENCTWKEVAQDTGVPVNKFEEVQDKVAEISYQNPNLNLFFRGQDDDYGFNGDNKISELRPAIYREVTKTECKNYMCRTLKSISKDLLDEIESVFPYKRKKFKELGRFPETIWAILQHYHCPTPLLDITSSLHVATSFATLDLSSDKLNQKGYIYVLALPNIQTHISYYAEHCLVLVKLRSVCPPSAKRPHYQEGYLVGTIPHTAKASNYPYKDFNQKLIAKFLIENPECFWQKSNISCLEKTNLMPNDDDFAEIVCRNCYQKVINFIETGLNSSKWRTVKECLQRILSQI